MPFPKLSPLQSRLAASVLASLMLLLLYFTLSSPHFAYASEIDSIHPEDHNHERLLFSYLFDNDDDEEDLDSRELEYESTFVGVDRGIIGRASTDPIALTNNVAGTSDLKQGETVMFKFSNSSLWGNHSDEGTGLPSPVRLVRRSDAEMGDATDYLDEDQTGSEDVRLRPRQVDSGATREVYISLNTCNQPATNKTSGIPPQLELYVSTSPDNTSPGPDSTGDQTQVTIDGGAGMFSFDASGDIYVAVTAPNTTNFYGTYSVSVAASIDDYYHYYNSSETNLYLIDSDGNSALLITNNLTTLPENSTVYQEWMNLAPPFGMFANNQNDTAILGIQHSYCGLENYAQIAATKGGVHTDIVQMGMTSRGLGNLPKQQFYFDGLNASSSYYGILAMNGNSTATGDGVVGGGGKVWKTMNFTTLSGMRSFSNAFMIVTDNSRWKLCCHFQPFIL
jgi:calcium channel MID1